MEGAQGVGGELVFDSVREIMDRAVDSFEVRV